MKQIAKLQAKSWAATNNNSGAINTLEVVLIIIAILVVVGVVWGLYINHVNEATGSVKDTLDDAPLEMAEDFVEKLGGLGLSP